jgi:hypothetical protein
MSPEAPGNVVVLDLHLVNSDLTGSVERVSSPQQGPPDGFLRVRFDAATKEDGFYKVGGGVAWVSQPKRYVHSQPDTLRSLRAGSVMWQSFHDTMFSALVYGPKTFRICDLPINLPL